MEIKLQPAYGMVLFAFDGYSILLERSEFDKLIVELFANEKEPSTTAVMMELVWAGLHNRYTTPKLARVAKMKFMQKLKELGFLPSLGAPRYYKQEGAIRVLASYLEAQWQTFGSIGFEVAPVVGMNGRIVRIEILESSVLPRLNLGRLFGFEPQRKVIDVVQFEESDVTRLSGTVDKFEVQTNSGIYLFACGNLSRSLRRG
jgi:hypothetical protein